MGSSEAAFHGVLQGRRDDACRWARPRRLSTGFCRAAEAMLADGLVQGGFLRDFAGSPRRCSPKGSSEAAFHGLLQGRRGDACRWARPRRLSTGFSNGGAARSAAVPFCPSFPRRLAVLLSLPSARTTMPHEHIPVHANRRAVPTLFHIFPARPSRVSSFTLPPGQRYRARSPRRCSPKGSSEAGFHGLLQGRRGDASRWARLRRLSAGFCRVAEAMLPDGLVRGGFPRGFATAALRAAPPFPFVLLSPATWPYFFLYHPPGQRCRAPLFLHPFVPLGGRDSAAFFAACTGGGVVRSLFALSAARPALHLFFYTPPPGERMPRARSRPCEPAGSPFPFPHFPTARPYFFLYHPPGQRCRTSTFPFTQTGGQSLPFSTFSRAPESCFFLYPAARPTIPRATFPSSICPAGRQGQRRFLCRLPGRRSSALPFRPIGGAPGTAPLFLHPAARGTDAARPFPPMRTGGQSLPFSTFSYRPVVLLSLPSRPANDAARHFSCILLSRRAAGTAPRSLPPARVAEQRAPFSPYRRRARHCTSFSTPRRPGNGCRASVPAHANRRAVPSLFHIFLPPGRTSFFTQPSCQRYRAPLFLHPFVPLGGRDSAAFFAACTGGGAARSLFALSAARPALHLFFCTPPPGERMPRARSRPCEPAGSPFPFPHFPARPSHASSFTQPPGQRYRARSPRRCFPMVSSEVGFLRAFAGPPRRCFPLGSSEAATHGSFPLLLRAAAPVRGCSRRISPSISAPLCLPRSPLLCARPFRAGFFGSAPPCSPPPRAVSGPVPARADASRRSFAFPLARRAPFLPCAPCAPGLCASRRGDGRSASPARPACVETTHSKSPARQRIPARPACMPAPRTPGASVPPRTPGASVPPRAAVRFGSHPAVQARPIFFHRQAGKRTQKANLIRTYVRIRF